MPAVVGSAEFQLAVNIGNFNAGFDAAQRQAQAGSAKIAQTIDANFKRVEQSAARTNASLTKTLNFAAIAAGFAVIGGGAAAVNASLESIIGTTARLEQAQFRMSKTFGGSAAEMSQFAQQLAKATGNSNVALQEGISRLSVLRNGYGLTIEQIQKLSQVTLDLAAATGTDTVEAFERVIGVFRDGGESAEKLGLVLNDATIKAVGDLTAEQRKNFEQMDALSKSQIRYTELMRQASGVQGTAVERSESQFGSFKRLEAAMTDLAGAVGTALAPALAETAEQMIAVVNALQQLNEIKIPDWMIGKDVIQGPSLFERIFGRKWGEAPPGEVLIGPGGSWIDTSAVPEAATAQNTPNQPFGPTPTEVRNAQLAVAAERKTAVKAELDARKDDVERRAQIEIDGLEKEKQAVERSYAARRAALENQKDAEIKAAEDTRDGAIKAIEAQAQAAEDGYRRQVIAAEKARDAELKAAEDRRDGAIDAIEAEQDAAEAANEAQIRQFEIERDRARQAAEDRRDAAVDALDAEKRAREDARITEDRANDDANTAAQRSIEARHDAAIKALQDEAKAAERTADRKVRALDREIEKARETSQKRIAALERAADRESELHARTMRALDDERDARLDALDVQLKALDAQEGAVDAAERMANLQQRLAAAQRGVVAATGTGTPQEVGEAREALTRAIRVGNEVSIANARAQLQQLAGQGAQAIAKAQEELADATGEIQHEQTQQARDGERDRLEAAKDAIQDELDARKRAEDDRNAAREREIASDRGAEQKKLATRLNALERQKKAAQDSSRDELERIKERVDAEKESHDLIVQQERDIALQAKRAIEDRRRAEDQADQNKRKAIETTYEEEQRQIKATYDDEETGVIPALKRAADAAEREFARQKEAVNERYKAEQEQIRLTYDDKETGIIAKIQAQAEATRRDYDAAKTAVNERYNDEKARIVEVYDDPEHGLFKKLEDSKQNTIAALNDQILNWQRWKTDVVKEIGEALAALDAFIARVGSLENIEIGVTGPDGKPVKKSPVEPTDRDARGSGTALGAGQKFGVSFGWDQPYNGPYGGAAWPGGPLRHRGIDLTLPGANGGKGTPYGSFRDGVVIAHTWDPAGGNGILVQGDDGLYEYYGHNDRILVGGPGTRFRRGDQIGVLGSSGLDNDAQSHLHYEVRRGLSGDPAGQTIDPRPYMGGQENTAGGQPGAADEEITIQLFGRTIRIRGRANIEGFIRQAAKDRGINPDTAVAVAKEEGGVTEWNRRGTFDTGSSYGPFQLHYAGGPTPERGLGDAFTALTGKHATQDPRGGVLFALDHARRSGWGAWYGAAKIGIHGFDGIAGHAGGTMIREPTLLAGLTTGRLGIAGETGQPERLLGVSDTRSYGRGGDVTTINVMGIGLNEVAAEIERRQHRQQLLRGGRR